VTILKGNEYPYKFEYAEDNVYGHVFSLIEDLELPKHGVHLDIGCGWGAISDVIAVKKQLHYIGIDANQEAVNHLLSEGKEAYSFRLTDSQSNLEFIERILNGRPISSISIIDTLEHVFYLEEVMDTISRLSLKYNAPVIISVPNFTHNDVVLKLLCNKLDETATGLLDKTHVNIFSEDRLVALCQKYGLHQIKQKDVRREKSDQYFPKELLTLAEKSSLRQLLLNLRKEMDGNGEVYQFVRMFIASHPVKHKYPAPQEQRPFLSIITRTVGDRPEELKEVLLCLTGQECTDFEVIVVGHNLTVEKQISVEGIINSTPEWIRSKIRLVRVNGGNRSTPLNVGFEQANGQYITILDDDDIVFSNWVKEFKELSKEHYGKILRTVSVRQEYDRIKTKYSQSCSMAVSGFKRDYPPEFDYFTMLHHNQSPGLCLAFPRALFHDLKLRFDESINTIEDWDFILRGAFICGVASSPVVTNIYRWWRKGSNSQTLHSEQEWNENYQYVLRKIDSRHLILPPGSAKKINWLVDAYIKNAHSVQSQNVSGQIVNEQGIQPTYDSLMQKREVAHQILASDSWFILKPFKKLMRIFGKQINIPDVFRANEKELDDFINNVKSSIGWKITGVIRRIRE